jgi:putative ABC transport system permease protein
VFAHYLTVAFLVFRQRPISALINVVTLTLGVVCFIAVFAVVDFWSRAEQHFANGSRIAVVTSEWHFSSGEQVGSGKRLSVNHWFAGYLQADFPRLEAVARAIQMNEQSPVRAGDRAVRLRSVAADAQFLKIFDLPFVAGDSVNALREPRSVVLTREAAQRLYGDRPALGQSIVVGNRWDGVVTGVIDDVPEPSHMGRSKSAPLRFDMLVSRDFFENVTRSVFGRDTTEAPEDWFTDGNMTYVLLPADGSLTLRDLRRQLPEFATRHVPAEQVEYADVKFDVVPVRDLLGMAASDSLFPQQGGVSLSVLLLLLGAVVLAVACVNFANLATARVITRAREVGVRKTFGAKRTQVVQQYLLEACIQVIVAVVLAVAVAALLMPVLNAATGIQLSLASLTSPRSMLTLVALVVVVTFAAASYPAFLLSGIRPISAFAKGGLPVSRGFLSPILVGTQFAAAALLLVTLTVVYLQNRHLEQARSDLAAAPLVIVENAPQVTGLRNDTLRDELLRLPNVTAATALAFPPWTEPPFLMRLKPSLDGAAPETTALLFLVGYDFFDTFGIAQVAGRVFDPQRSDDVAALGQGPTGEQNIVVSRTLAAELGFEQPAQALDRIVYIPQGEVARPNRIIGVVEDKALIISSGFGSRPSVYLFNPRLNFHVARLSTTNVPGTLQSLDALWSRLVPGVAPSRRLVNEYFQDSYAYFAHFSWAVASVALIALLISTIGLFAITLLVASRRGREIAVRKTFGASTRQILLMLFKSFLLPVLVANLIAWPLAVVVLRRYLSVFVDAIPLTATPFIFCLAVTFLIAAISVGGQAARAARVGPGRALKHE